MTDENTTVNTESTEANTANDAQENSSTKDVASTMFDADSKEENKAADVADNNTEDSDSSSDSSDTTEEGKDAEESKEGDENEATAYDDVVLPQDLPEGMEVDENLFAGAKEIAAKHNLPPEALQEMVDLYAGRMTEAEGKINNQWKEIEEGWKTDAKNDQEIGGDKFDVKLEKAKRALKVFGSDGLNEALEQTRIGNHPELIRLLSRIGEKITEDGGFDTGNSSGQRSRGDVLFDNS